MDIQTLQAFFMWCSIINVGLMIISGILMIIAGEWAYKIHSKWFNISKQAFDIAIYSFLGVYKLLTFVFCIVPWIALSIIG